MDRKKNLKNSKLKKIVFSFVLILAVLLFYSNFKGNNYPILSPYPNGKNFAFTITADPDHSTFENDKIIYDYFSKIGLRTTIAVWVQDATRSNGMPDIDKELDYGDSCERYEYLQYMKELQNLGFEIALHTVSSGNDYRNQTNKGYELFKKYFGTYPDINIMHSKNLENIYWGKKVISNNLLSSIISMFSSRSNIPFQGEVSESKYFWGDILKEKTKYVRLWGTSDINTLEFNPSMPYHDSKKPFVNYWFSFSDGYKLKNFNKLLKKENIKSLVKKRGASIVYVHFSTKFVENNKLNDIFKERLTFLTNQKDGWFVPATKLLNRLLIMKSVKIKKHNEFIYVSNFNNNTVNGITILFKPYEILYSSNGETFKSNEDGEIVLESLNQGETIILMKKKFENNKETSISLTEELNMLFQRLLVYIKHNYL